jgi:hypothetical protein
MQIAEARAERWRFLGVHVSPGEVMVHLYGLLILRHGRRQILWLGVTAHPTAEWIARQLTEACGWECNPSYIVRDRDREYGEFFIRRPRFGHS